MCGVGSMANLFSMSFKRAPQYGYCLPIFANPGGRLFRTPNWATLDGRRAFELGVLAEELGFDSVWVADHLMLGADEAILEGWTTLSALAGATQSSPAGIDPSGTLLPQPCPRGQDDRHT